MKTPPNKSPQPTGVGACSSAVAGDGFWSPVAELFSLDGFTRMDKNSVLILWLVAFTAAITLITKIVEMVSAFIKYRNERTKPAQQAAASSPIQPIVRHTRSSAFILLSDLVVLPVAIVALLAMYHRSTPATVSDVVQIVICASAIIISGHRLTPAV
jgi:hypothetical protein